MTIEVAQSFPSPTRWLNTLEPGDHFINPKTGHLYVVLTEESGCQMRVFRFEDNSICSMHEEHQVFQVNLKIQWEVA